MKHVRALKAEPGRLTEYHTTHPTESQRPADQAAAAWDTFKTDKPAYAELLGQLAQTQQGLCAYCEQRLVDATGQLVPNDYQIEHVLAKSGAVGRVLDWTNLALACIGGTYKHHQDVSRRFTDKRDTSCGQAKGDDDLPPGGDPRGHPLLDPLVEIGIDGRLCVNDQNCIAAGVAPKAVADTIALLNLDCERLRKTRQDRRDNVNAWVVPLLAELLAEAHLGPADHQQIRDLIIAGRLQPDSLGYLRAFWTTERSALGPDAETWIANNQALFA